MKDVAYLIELLSLSETDVVKALLTAFGPPQPGVLRQSWRNNKVHGHDAPSTAAIWDMYVKADFRCTLCGSGRRITLDHIDGDATNHVLENLRVVCSDCNRRLSSRGTQDVDAQLRIFRSFIKLHEQLGRFPTRKEIKLDARVQQISGATYMLKFLKQRLTNKCN